jgi:hypothetical protein
MERSVVVTVRQHSTRWCPNCQLQSQFVLLSEIVANDNLTENDITQNHQLHLDKQTDGQVFVCLNSLGITRLHRKGD